jgi:4,5-dihydroxyphthalate decarboxylase
MADQKLRLVTGRRYETKFLLDGTVKVRDFDVECIDAGPAPWPVFRDMVTTISYDIGEQAMSHYLLAKDRGKPLTAIPVFTSRFFPQMGVTINRSSGIREPGDLVGKRVGVAGFGYNPAAWIRSILAHQYEVPVERIIWVEDAEDRFLAGLDYPRSRRFTIERAADVAGLVVRGEIDANIPAGGGPAPTETTKKLFDDGYAEIRAYVRDTGVFPINTVMTLKEAVVDRYPDLPARLMEAFSEARGLYMQELSAGKETDHMGIKTSALQEMGLFPDQYGLAPNRLAVRMMVQYCYEQGLIRKLYEPEELFV